MVTICFPPLLQGSSLTGDSERYETINKPLTLEMDHLSSNGPCWGNMEESFFTRDFERKVRFYFIRRPCLLETPGRM